MTNFNRKTSLENDTVWETGLKKKKHIKRGENNLFVKAST